MGGPPAVSIITPTHNHGEFLAECVGSVLGQTFASWEQIVIDDGSTDATPELMARFRDPRIRYLRQPRRGIERLAETYNSALAVCRAPLIAILEGDDTWPANKLEALVPAFADEGVVLAYGVTEVVGDGKAMFPARIPSPGFESFFLTGTLANVPVGSATLAMLDYRGLTFTYPCSVILRRRTLEAIGGFQHRPGLVVTDYPTFLRLSIEGRFHFDPRTMGYWRIHQAGTTANYMDQILAEIHRETLRFRGEFADHVRLRNNDWRDVDSRWQVALGGIAMRGARRLLLDGRWGDARAGLIRAMLSAEATTKVAALAGFVGSFVGHSVEWAYRLTGRAWFEQLEQDTVRLVWPTRTKGRL